MPSRGHIVADERQSMPTMQKELHPGTSSFHSTDFSRRAEPMPHKFRFHQKIHQTARLAHACAPFGFTFGECPLRRQASSVHFASARCFRRGTGGVERDAPHRARPPPHRTVRAVFPHTALRVGRRVGNRSSIWRSIHRNQCETEPRGEGERN